jgi:hypothetical protein
MDDKADPDIGNYLYVGADPCIECVNGLFGTNENDCDCILKRMRDGQEKEESSS